MCFGFLTKRRLFSRRMPAHFFISLGRNCEPALRFKEYYGAVDSTLLTYAGFYDPMTLPSLLKDVHALLLDKLIPIDGADMFKCEKARLAFHCRHSFETLKTKEDWAAEEAECRSRIAHLIEKTHRIFKDARKKLFVLTVWEPTEEAYAMVLQTADILRTLTVHYDFVIVTLKTKNQKWQKNEKYPELHFRFLTHFSPFDKVVNPAFTDQKGWRRIWKEFPVQ